MEAIIRQKFINRCIWGILIFLICMYAMYTSYFAESYLNLPFLDFPIFIGEWGLFICFLLISAKFILKSPLNKNVIYFLIVIQILFVLLIVNAVSSYLDTGPYAFRNAALFYYILFGVVSFFAYEKKLFNDWLVLCFAVFVMALVLKNQIDGYFIFPFILILFTLISNVRNNKRRQLLFCFWAIAFAATLFLMFKGIARAQIIGFVFAIIYISSWFLKFFNQLNIYIRLFIIFVFIFGGISFYYNNANSSNLRILMKPKIYFSDFYDAIKYIKENESDYVETDIKFINFYNNNIEHNQMIEKDLQERFNQKIINKVSQQRYSARHFYPIENAVSPSELQDFFNAKHGDSLIQATVANNMRTNEIFILRENKTDFIKSLFKANAKRQTEIINMSVSSKRDEGQSSSNIVFRLLIWKDLIQQMIDENKWFGFGLAKPTRSKSIEILMWALSEWKRDGWIMPHNAFFHIIYRTGILGVLMIAVFFVYLFKVAAFFYKHNIFNGILLVSCIFYWVGISFFSVTLELPQFAIFFWVTCGAILAKYYQLKDSVLGDSN